MVAGWWLRNDGAARGPIKPRDWRWTTGRMWEDRKAVELDDDTPNNDGPDDDRSDEGMPGDDGPDDGRPNENMPDDDGPDGVCLAGLRQRGQSMQVENVLDGVGVDKVLVLQRMVWDSWLPGPNVASVSRTGSPPTFGGSLILPFSLPMGDCEFGA